MYIILVFSRFRWTSRDCQLVYCHQSLSDSDVIQDYIDECVESNASPCYSYTVTQCRVIYEPITGSRDSTSNQNKNHYQITPIKM